MTILLQWLVAHAWFFYVACAIGVAVYTARALAAQREQSLALFTLERETAAAQALRAWAMVAVFVVIGITIFVSVTFILPTMPSLSEIVPPTATPSAGLETPTPGPTASPGSGDGGLLLTFTPTATPTSPPTPTSEGTLPAETPTPAPTDTPEGAVTGEVNVIYGDYAELVGFSLPSLEVTPGEPLMLTLYWRALEGRSPMNYLVFTHLLSQDEQVMVAQHDGAPGGGLRPFDTWTPGETIVDVHPMAFKDVGYSGPAKIAVGLYDPATGRALTATGADRVILPVMLLVQ